MLNAKQQISQALNQGDIETAFKLLRNICTNNNKDLQALSMLSTVCLQLKKYAQAEQCLKQVLKIEPLH